MHFLINIFPFLFTQVFEINNIIIISMLIIFFNFDLIIH